VFINNNSILYYSCAESAATRSITDTARCKYTIHNNNSKNNSIVFYTDVEINSKLSITEPERIKTITITKQAIAQNKYTTITESIKV
jgi:hypothetical protein